MVHLQRTASDRSDSQQDSSSASGPWLAAADVLTDVYLRWLRALAGGSSGAGVGAPEWTTANRTLLDLSTMRFRDFSTDPRGLAAVICAPYALHGALIADFAPGHSIVEALRLNGLRRIFVTDWKSATPEMRFFSIDTYLSELNAAVDEVGSAVDLIGLCQGGWLSLIYAARFPKKVRRLVLVGTPIDTSISSGLTQMASVVTPRTLSAYLAAGGGIMSGRHTLNLWHYLSGTPEAGKVLQRDASHDLRNRFNAWYDRTVDLPGTYYLQVDDLIFRQNQIAKGRFMALGRTVNLAEHKNPIFHLVATADEVVPLVQALATQRLVGTPSAFQEVACEHCGHLSLFMGATTLNNSWRRIADWLQSAGSDTAFGPGGRKAMP